MKAWLLVTLALLCSGCVGDGFRQFYTEEPDAQHSKARRVAPPPATPRLDLIDGSADLNEYSRQGYVPIGHSVFNAASGAYQRGAVQQGIRVGADVVVLARPEYTNTKNGMVPVVTRTIGTAYTHGSDTIVDGSVTSTDVGTAVAVESAQTKNVAQSIDRYRYGAIYMVKRKYSFGAWYAPLNNDDRSLIGSNKGVKVTMVVNDTPAFDADVLVGDFILSLNGEPITGYDSMNGGIDANLGKDITLEILRREQRITKTVHLRPMD